ncbi:sterol desaturase family protein [Reyranella sp.]|uniref:sterol desaturase family protein n=1 Tax=Reyranella sp. TaxID=1929291 RepID=UPI003C7B3A99
MTLSTLLTWSLPAVIALASLEGLILTFVARRPYDWLSFAASLTDVLVREYLVYAFVGISLAAPFIEFAWQHRLTTVPLNGVASFALLFLGQEFCYYWYHRAAHRVRWFWATHAVHHSPNEFNLGIAYRFGWTGRIAGNALFFVPMIWLGFAPKAVFAALALNLLYQFWLHTEWVPKLGWLEYVLNTPSHHRVHHASNHDYIDANYGGVLIVFDRLFGTYVGERADLPCRYGLVKPLISHNPIRIAFHEWLNLASDLRAARSWREGWGYLFGPPGWRPRQPATIVPTRSAPGVP